VETIEDKLENLESCGTWEVAELLPDKRCIGCRWIFKLKRDSEGKIARYRARLVA